MEMIWLRISSIDGAASMRPGSWSPSTSQRILVLSTVRLRLREVFPVPHDDEIFTVLLLSVGR